MLQPPPGPEEEAAEDPWIHGDYRQDGVSSFGNDAFADGIGTTTVEMVAAGRVDGSGRGDRVIMSDVVLQEVREVDPGLAALYDDHHHGGSKEGAAKRHQMLKPFKDAEELLKKRKLPQDQHAAELEVIKKSKTEASERHLEEEKAQRNVSYYAACLIPLLGAV